MILGAQLYTVRDFMKNEEDFARTMDKIAAIGYKYVQVSGIGAVSPEAIKKAVDNTGLKVILTHTSADRILKETDKVIEEHTLFGCDGIGIGGIFNYKPFTLESFKRFADDSHRQLRRTRRQARNSSITTTSSSSSASPAAISTSNT